MLKRRRLLSIEKVIGIELFKGQRNLRILDVGVANGKDCIQLLSKQEHLELFGIDLVDSGLRQSNFTMLVADAEKINYPDNYFDLTVSIGVLEHIRPIEKLSRVIKEIDRVSKSFCVVVPSIATLFEPHVMRFRWQLQDYNRQVHNNYLSYLNDWAWLQFEGFSNAHTKRFSYVPVLIDNLFIYKLALQSHAAESF